MLYPDVTVEEWCKRYPALERYLPAFCLCGRSVNVLKPYVAKNTLGLSSEACVCGRARPFSAAIFRDESLKEELLSALFAL
jgi:hypothetical protein